MSKTRSGFNQGRQVSLSQQENKSVNNHSRQRSGISSNLNINNISVKTNLKNSKRRNRKQKNVRISQVMDGSTIVKHANYYFDKNPTYLKETEVGDAANMNLKRYVEYFGHERIPQFGYPQLHFEDDYELTSFRDQSLSANYSQKQKPLTSLLLGKTSQSSKKQVQFHLRSPQSDKTQKKLVNKNFQDFIDGEDLPFKKALNLKRRQDRIINHVFKCFTFGKKVRRQIEDDVEVVSRVDILKRRFQRLNLVRQYFSVQSKSQYKKFQYPVNESGKIFDDEALKIYDELQYCQESDPEDHEYIRKQRRNQESQEMIQHLLIERHHSLENLNINKKVKSIQLLDKESVPTLSLKEQDLESDNTFNDILSDFNCNSVYSSPRQLIDKEQLAYDKFLPFDFITQRKAKKFYKEDLCDIKKLLQNKEAALKELKLLQNKNQNIINLSSEEDCLPDLPETYDKFKEDNRIVPRKKQRKIKDKKLVIKGELSSSSDDERFAQYRFGEKVQNTQIRDQNNDLQGIFFQRSQAKTHKLKNFKNNISTEQRDLLQNRQFVIVDVKSLNTQNKHGFFNKRQNLIQQEQKEKESKILEDEEKEQKQLRLQQIARLQILKEKQNFSSRNNSVVDLRENQKNQRPQTFSEVNNQRKDLQVNKNLYSGFSSTISSRSNLNQLPQSAQSQRVRLQSQGGVYQTYNNNEQEAPYGQMQQNKLLYKTSRNFMSNLQNNILGSYSNHPIEVTN